jgi:hypothetical protein
MTKSSTESSTRSSSNPTELLDRYLQAVRFWLPKPQQQDIIAELSEDLRSQIEDKETGLGRSLNETEIEALLQQRGRPFMVANRYLPQESLIGPVLFPIYCFVMKVVALCYLVPWVLVWIGMMSLSSSYRAEHASAGWFHAIASAWGALWSTAFMALATVTLVFAILERVQAKSRFLDQWNPRKLPPLRNPRQIPRAGSPIEVVVNLVFAGWWIRLMSSPVILDRPEIRIILSPVWRYFFWGFLLLAFVNSALAVINFARPYWTVPRASVRLITDGTAAGLFCWMSLLKLNALVAITIPKFPPAQMLTITNAINLAMARAFPFLLVAAVVIVMVDAYRIFRVKNPTPAAPLKGEISTAVI